MIKTWIPPENYQIDPRLKEGKHYPLALSLLTHTLKNPFPYPLGWAHTAKEKREFKQELALIEETFRKYFLSNNQKEQISRINRKIQNVRPKLFLAGEEGYKLAPQAAKGKGNLLTGYWIQLAEIIGFGLNPNLIRQCGYCKKIYFSKQRKKFHPQCRSKFISEKLVREGIAARRQKAYRERQKEKLGLMEKA